MVDSIPPDKFLETFHRLCQYVRLGRVRNPRHIKRRIKHVLDLLRQGYLTARRGSTIKKWQGNYKRLRTLYRHNIHERIWREAVESPEGIYDLTLDYGYENARKILRERARRKMGRLRRV